MRKLHYHLLRAHLNFLGQQRGFEVGLDDHLHLQLSAANLPYQRDDSEWQDDVFSGAIPARRGGETNHSSCNKMHIFYNVYTHFSQNSLFTFLSHSALVLTV